MAILTFSSKVADVQIGFTAQIRSLGILAGILWKIGN